MARARPLVGVGIIIPNDRGEVLVGHRIGSHAQKWSIPGGSVELGESFERAAIREGGEEHNLLLIEPKLIAITNNLETFELEGFHSISVILLAQEYVGEPEIMEPTKCDAIMWANPRALPEPHFDASRLAIQCYLNGTFYEGIRG